jgi:type IV pilus assembly protein PilC
MKYHYLARTTKGEIQTGAIEARDETIALETLQAHNLIVVSLKSEKKIPLLTKRIKLFERVKGKDVFIFFRELSILVDADVPLVQSLKTLSQQAGNAYFKEVLFDIASSVEGGMSFSKALEKYPKIFSGFCVNLIKSAEVSGRLSEALLYLADSLEKNYYLLSKVKGAMIYPGFILFAFTVIGVIMMITVVPQMKGILEEAGQELPLPTKIILGLSDFMKSKGWLLLIIAAGLVYLIRRLLKTEKGRRVWHLISLKLPIFGRILKQTYLAQFSDSLSALIQGGVPIVQALSVAAGVVSNVVFKEIIMEAKEKVKAGQNISPILEEHKEFPPLFTQMMKTGEQTGKMDVILDKLAVFYNKEVDNIVENLSKLIEPLLILALGGAVIVLVVAILLPMYNITGSM